METESLETAWRSLRDTLEERRSRLGKVTEEARAASRAASLLSAQTPWFWLSGLLGVGTLAGVVIHDRRHELRRWLGGRGRRGLMPWAIAAGLVLAGLAIAAILLQDRVGQDLGRTVDGQPPPQTGMATASSSTPLSPGEMRRSYEALKRGQETVLAASYQPIAEALGPASRLAAQCRALRIDAIELGGRVALVERLASAVEADLAALEEVNRELATQEEAAAGYVRIRQGVRAGLGVGLLGFVATGGWLLRRGAARRREACAEYLPALPRADRLRFAVVQWPAAHGDRPLPQSPQPGAAGGLQLCLPRRVSRHDETLSARPWACRRRARPIGWRCSTGSSAKASTRAPSALRD